MADSDKDLNHSRRNFIKKSSFIAVAVSFIPLTGCKDKAGTEPEPVVDDCETTDDILGPFYKAGAPLRENIIPDGNNTEPLVLEGKVYSDCDDPVADAMVEIWNANEEGSYDDSEEFLFRGRYQTLSDGVYRFRTIIPGRYLNGATFRPSHIHFRITAPGFQELISQIYFKEDPFIASDPWASTQKAQERILPISKDTTNTDIVNFDIHMKRNS
jgi:catechol 1,2-dioxygenase